MRPQRSPSVGSYQSSSDHASAGDSPREVEHAEHGQLDWEFNEDIVDTSELERVKKDLCAKIQLFVREFGALSLPNAEVYRSYSRAHGRFSTYTLYSDQIELNEQDLLQGHQALIRVPGVTLRAIVGRKHPDGSVQKLVLFPDGREGTVHNSRHSPVPGGAEPERCIGPIWSSNQVVVLKSRENVQLWTMKTFEAQQLQYTSTDGDVWKQKPPTMDMSSSTWFLQSTAFPNQVFQVIFHFDTGFVPRHPTH
ncbi:hypothetical protein JCM5353_003697 [Sporobolomyces roseus]